MKLRSINDYDKHRDLSRPYQRPSGAHYDRRRYTSSSQASSSSSKFESDLNLNLHDVLKAARITDIAVLPKYLTHDSHAVRQMAEMCFRRITTNEES